MPAKLIVAYRTQLVPGLQPVMADELQPPANFKHADAIEKWRAEQLPKLEAKFQAECAQQPYTATFAEVQIADLHNERKGKWVYRAPNNEEGKQAACLAIRSWLLKEYPDAWPHTTHPDRRVPAAIFVGFNPRLFLKILGIECSLPAHQPMDADGKPDPKKLNVLPLSMWYPNSDHRDIEEAVKPADFKYLPWNVVLEARGLLPEFKDWKAPGVNVTMDLKLATRLAAQLGMLNETD